MRQSGIGAPTKTTDAVDQKEIDLFASGVYSAGSFESFKAPEETKDNRMSINEILAILPEGIKLNDGIAKTFKRLSPLTLEKFTQIAQAYQLLQPDFNQDGTKYALKQDADGNVFAGQYNSTTGEKCGFMRHISKEGNFLSEQVMFGELIVGMSRHIDSTGCVAYVISDRDGKVIESKFYDKMGRIVK